MTEPTQEQPSKMGMSLVFVFDTLPDLDKVSFAENLPKIEPIGGAVTTEMDVQGDDPTAGSVLHTIVKFGDHSVQMAGFSFPAPADVIEHTVQVSSWNLELKPPLFNHKAHILAFYRGTNPDPVEQLVALFKVGACFQSENLLGVLDVDGWNCTPTSILSKMLEPEMLKSFRQTIPFGIWAGFVKMFKAEDTVWFCTKGLYRFGANDMAFLGRLNDGKFAFDTFDNLFHYMRSGAVLRPGHSAQIGDTYLKFREVYEYADFLDTPGGTLVIERISPAEANRH